MLVLWGLTCPAQGYGRDQSLRSVDRSYDENLFLQLGDRIWLY
ncbi:uncharacterized protein METZ01_LOCUS204336, partial [marine metagenome]